MAAKTLCISPQALRTIAASLKQSSTRSEQLQHTLERAWVQLDAGWDSYAEADLTYSYNHTLNEQGRTIAMLAQMAQALEAAADVIEAADLASQALFDLSNEPGGGIPGFPPGGIGELPPRQGGVNPLPPLPEELQLLLDELLALLGSFPPGTSWDDLLTLLDGQPVAIVFQVYLGASAAFNPGAIAVTGSVYVAYNFQSHELSLILGDEAALGVAGGAEADVGGGVGAAIFLGAESNDVFNGGCTNFTAGVEGAVIVGAEASITVTVVNDPDTGAPAIGLGLTNGITAGGGGDISATISVPGMNNATVLYTIEDVDLTSFNDIPTIIGGIIVDETVSTAQQAVMIPLIAGITAGSVIWSGAENAIDLGGDIWELLSAGSVNTSPFPPVPVQTPTQPTEQTPTLAPTPSSPTQDSTDHPIATPEANPTPEMTPTAPTETPTFQGTATPTPP